MAVCRAVIFDMDGTVLDTLGDLTDAVNYTMEQAGHRHDFRPEEVRHFVGGGAGNILRRALAYESGVPLEVARELGQEPEETLPSGDEASRLLSVFRPYYAGHCNIRTGPYAGIRELLARLRGAGIRTGVVSNKPDPAVQTLAAAHFPGMFDCSMGEREGIPRKPAPDMVEDALVRLGVGHREEAVYVGDSEVDLETSANAGLACICVDWGFRGRAFLEQRGARIVVSRPEEIEELVLRSWARTTKVDGTDVNN